MNDPSTNRFVSERAVEEWQNACLQRTWYELIPFRNVLRMDGERMYTQAQKSARFARLIIVFFLSYWAAPSEGRRWYPRKPLHYNHRFCPRLVGAVAVGVKDVLSLWYLLVLLLIRSIPGQLEARASCWCSVECCCPPILPGLHCLYVRALSNRRSASDVGVSTPCGAMSIQENIIFVHGVLELQEYIGIFNPHGIISFLGGAGSTCSSQLAIGQKDWGFHIARRDADPGDSRFTPRGIGVVAVRKHS